MTFTRFAAVLIAVISLFAVTASAQRRPATKRKYPPTPKVVTTTTASATSDVAKAKETTNNQIKNITKFVDVLGPIAQSIESIDNDAKTKKLKKETLDANAANKQKVIVAIRNLRAGLEALENDFTTKPALKKFLPKIQGISALGVQSETLAKTNRFSDSRKPLLSVVEKLTDTLATLP